MNVVFRGGEEFENRGSRTFETGSVSSIWTESVVHLANNFVMLWLCMLSMLGGQSLLINKGVVNEFFSDYQVPQMP